MAWALLHHEEFRKGVLSLARGIYLAGEKKAMVITSNHSLLVVLKKKPQIQLPEKKLQTFYLYLHHQFTRL